ncbi:MAG TPA: glycosyltransferase family A protein, partial [Syntrophomonadaceae bacterium]|nr:glycosyltransferase family A protein [Syntrophomonadaceae bacterium]
MHDVNKATPNATSAFVSVITCTNRLDYMDNVFNNFTKQKYKRKELIVILNNNKMDIEIWRKMSHSSSDIKIYQLDENISLGECLNFAVLQSDSEFIAKFDDDDYYGPDYLRDSIKAFKHAEAGVVGKRSNYVFFEEFNILALRSPHRENCYVEHLDGPSLIIKREVFDHVKFRDITRGEDKYFCKDCINVGIKLYSTNRFHHVYIRHKKSQQHTWTIKNKDLLRTCKVIAKDVNDF